jgi:hypothetical protein
MPNVVSMAQKERTQKMVRIFVCWQEGFYLFLLNSCKALQHTRQNNFLKKRKNLVKFFVFSLYNKISQP